MNPQSLKQMTLFMLRSLLRNKIAFFFSLVLPVIFVAVFGAIYSPADAPGATTIGLVDRDGGPVATALSQSIEATGLCRIVTGSESDLTAKMTKGSLLTILVLPEGLSQAAVTGQLSTPVTVVRDPSSAASNQAAALLMSHISRMGYAMTGSQPVVQPVLTDLPGLERFQTFDFLMPGQLVYMLLSAALMSVAIELASQRASGTLRHLFSTPLSVSVWATARMISTLVLAGVQIIVLFAAGWLMFRVQMPANLPGTIVLLALSSLAILGLGLLIGVLTRTPEASFPISMIAFMTIAILGNAMMPLDNAPAFMQTLARFMPSTYMTHALRSVMMQGKGLSAVATDIVVLIACAVVFNGLAIWRMRRQMVAA